MNDKQALVLPDTAFNDHKAVTKALTVVMYLALIAMPVLVCNEIFADSPVPATVIGIASAIAAWCMTLLADPFSAFYSNRFYGIRYRIVQRNVDCYKIQVRYWWLPGLWQPQSVHQESAWLRKDIAEAKLQELKQAQTWNPDYANCEDRFPRVVKEDEI